MALFPFSSRTWLLIIAGLIVIPFFTVYITTVIFYRTANNKGSKKRPPTIPYWIPGVFHGFGIFYQGASTFLAEAIKEYGNFAPFVIRLGLQPLLLVRKPEHVKVILRSSKQITPTAFELHVFERVMGASKEVVEEHRLKARHADDSAGRDNARTDLLPQPNATEIIPLSELHIKLLQKDFGNKMFQERFWTEIEDMWSFFQTTITKTTIEVVLRSSLIRQCPKVVRDFWQFDKHVETLYPGLPRFLNSSAHDSREFLVGNIQKWLESTHAGIESEKMVDETLESKYGRYGDWQPAKSEPLDFNARAVEILATLHEINTNTMPATFWFLFEALRDPAHVKYLQAEIKPYYNPAMRTYDIAGLLNIPIIQSMQAETGRLRTATASIRTCEVNNFDLDDEWTISKGTSIIVLSQDLALNKRAWAEARPETVLQPLDTFWAQRFLIPEKSRYRDRDLNHPNRAKGAKFSMEGIETLHLASGAGQPLTARENLAKALQVATIALLLTEFDVELSEPEQADAVIPPLREAAFGTIEPLDKIRVRIRKRTAPGPRGAKTS